MQAATLIIFLCLLVSAQGLPTAMPVSCAAAICFRPSCPDDIMHVPQGQCCPVCGDDVSSERTPEISNVEQAFAVFISQRNYRGGAMAAMKDSRLLYAGGQGVNELGHAVSAHTLFPVSSVSKSLTALAILRLVQTGKLGLADKVFGHGALLSFLKPVHLETLDPRLGDITVDHLLRHTAGWDLSDKPLLDPMLNQLYLQRGHDVPNISAELNLQHELTHYDVIRYAASQKLQYTPGTRVVYSNLGYSILGRIVEAVTDMTYEGFVKKEILEPCGMWHTRMGPQNVQTIENMVVKIKGINAATDSDHFSIFDVISPDLLDATLGWYSNVFDLMRLIRCMDNGLVSHSWLEEIHRKPETAPGQHSDTWFGAGFKVSENGALWQVNDPHSDDLLLYHSFRDQSQRQLPDTWIMLMSGRRVPQLKKASQELMEHLRSPQPHNVFLDDLTDVPLSTGYAPLVKFRIEEHHFISYINALRQSQFDIMWINAFNYHDGTFFSTIAKPMDMNTDPIWDYRVERGLTEQKLLSMKLKQEEEGFNMTFLMNYPSQAHADQYAYLAVFRRAPYTNDTRLKFGLRHFPQPYDKLVHVYFEAGYHPVVQSCLHEMDEDYISFMFLKRVNHSKVDFKNYHDLPTSKLDKVVMTNAKGGRRLEYLDSTQVHGKPRFSAIFTASIPRKWLFRYDLQQSEATRLIQDHKREGLLPLRLVGYVDKEDELLYALYMEEQTERPV